MNKIPLLRLLVFFIVGIITAVYLNTISIIPFYLFLIFLSGYLFLSYFKKITTKYSIRWLFGLFIYINFFLGGYSLTSFKINSSQLFLTHLNENQLFIGKITETPQAKEKSLKVILTIQNTKEEKWKKSANKVLVYIKKDSASALLDIGDIIVFKSQLKAISPPTNPNEFDYRNYLNYHFIYYQTFLNNHDWKLIHQSQSNNPFKIASRIRGNLIQSLNDKGLNGEELAVASALILGYKDDIDSPLKKSYSSAGAMHVLAVSGLHVGVVYLLFNLLLSFFNKMKYGNYLKSGILLVTLWCYALITGLSPSILRAATMFSFIIIAKMLNRNSNIFNTIAASAIVLLAINPLFIMEVGFQLSYAAVLGIVLIHPWLYALINPKSWFLDKIWEITAVSITAQIATFPLSLLYFHQFPNYFIFSNLIIIPLAIGILYLGIITISCLTIPVLSDYLIIALKYLTHFLNWTTASIEKLPYALSVDIRFSTLDTWLIYGIIILIGLLIAYRKFRFFLLMSILISFFLISILWRNFQDNKLQEIVIYNIPSYSTIDFMDKGKSVLIANKELIDNEDQLLFHVQNNWINKGIHNRDAIPTNSTKKTIVNPNLFTSGNFYQFYDYKLLLIDKKFHFKEEQQLPVDLVILSENTRYSLAQITKSFHPKSIVIDASNSSYTAKKFKKEALILGIHCHDVIKEGPFIKSIY